jgi:multicomponent Na+:H+ antiporter subunit D
MKNLVPWQEIMVNLVAVGTAISFAKFIFLPHAGGESKQKLTIGFWIAIILLLAALFLANAVYVEAYNLPYIIKALAVIGAGWWLYLGVFKKLSLKLSRSLEQFDNLVGMMSVMLVLLFWMVLA